tara:strand:- start:205 stop:633 length:429 start_codon:yes stop_codon:yes gene_type:complete
MTKQYKALLYNTVFMTTKVLSILILGATSNMTIAAGATMNASQLDAIMTGNTIYLTEPNSGGEIVLWYGGDGVAMARLPSGAVLDGTWSIKDKLSCIVWSYSPKDSCSILVKSKNKMILLEAGSNRLLGTLKTIAIGNVESL